MEQMESQNPENPFRKVMVDDPFERARLDDLKDTHIMDSEREMCFDLLTQLAAIVCKAPIALLSFIDSERQWFKSAVGFDIKELPKYLTPCNQTLNMQGGFFEIIDTEKDIPY